MAAGNNFFARIVAALRSSRGHNAMVFLAFLALSALLWWVMALNDEDQCDVRLPMRITHIPDSVTIITPAPHYAAVSLRAKGSQLLKLNFGRVPTMDIDFRAFRSNGHLRLTDADLKAVARAALDGAPVTVVTPDTLNLRYTTTPGQPVALTADVKVTPGPQATLSLPPKLSVDSVLVYSTSPVSVTSVSTEPVRLSGINRPVTRRVRVIAPAGCRVIPDSVDVTLQVEPLILKELALPIEPANVPLGQKLITFPAKARVSYMIPMSQYNKSKPSIRVVADYRDIPSGKASRMMRIRVADTSPDMQNVQIHSDSVEYIIENL